MAIKIDKNSRTYNEVMANVLRREYEFQAQRERNRMEGMRDVAMYSGQEAQFRERIAVFGSPRKWAGAVSNFVKESTYKPLQRVFWTVPRGASVANQSRTMYDLATDASYRAYQTDDEEERKRLLRESEKYRLYAKTVMDSDAIQNLEDLGNLDLSTTEGRLRVAGLAADAGLTVGGFLPVGAGVKGAQATSKLQRAVALSLGLGDVADVAVDAARGSQFVKQAVVSGVAQAPVQGALDTLITPEEDSLTDNIMYSAAAGVALNLGFGFLGYTGGEAVRGIRESSLFQPQPRVLDDVASASSDPLALPSTPERLGLPSVSEAAGAGRQEIGIEGPGFVMYPEGGPGFSMGEMRKHPVVDFTDTVKAQNINIPDDIDNVLEARNTVDTLAMLNGNVVGGKAFNLDVNDPRYINIKERMIDPLTQAINAKKAREGVSIDSLKGRRVRFTSQSGVELKGTVTDQGLQLDSGKVLPMDEKLEKALVKGFDISNDPVLVGDGELRYAGPTRPARPEPEILLLGEGEKIDSQEGQAKKISPDLEGTELYRFDVDGGERLILDKVLENRNEVYLYKPEVNRSEIVSIQEAQELLDSQSEMLKKQNKWQEENLAETKNEQERLKRIETENAKKNDLKGYEETLTPRMRARVSGILNKKYNTPDLGVVTRKEFIEDRVLNKGWEIDDKFIGFRNEKGFRVGKEITKTEEKYARWLRDSGVTTEAKFQTAEPKGESNNQLIEEARKYRSAEEFVKAQGTPVYHGSSSEITEFEIRNPRRELDPGDYGRGVYFAPDKKIAKSYGDKITEAFVDLANPYTADLSTRSAMIKSKNDLIDIINANSDLNLKKDYQGSGKILSEFIIEDVGSNEFSEIMQKAGYDGFIAKGNQPETVVFDPKKIKTKQQLTDIWKEANQRFQTSDAKNADEYVELVKNQTLENAMGHRPSEMGPGHDISLEGAIPEDVYDSPEKYFSFRADPDAAKSYQESIKALREIRNKPEAEVTIYRASPKNELRYGDWVTLSKNYAEGESLYENVEVNSFTVKAKDIQFAGDDINEFGYFPTDETLRAEFEAKQTKFQTSELITPREREILQEFKEAIILGEQIPSEMESVLNDVAQRAGVEIDNTDENSITRSIDAVLKQDDEVRFMNQADEDLRGLAGNVERLEEYKQIVRKYFDEKEVGVNFAAQIQTPQGQKALGVYYDKMITFAKDANDTTPEHEVLHAYFDLFVDQKEKSFILTQVKETQGLVDDLAAEEWMADDFVRYVREVQAGEVKARPESLIEYFKFFWEKIQMLAGKKDRVKSLYNDIIERKRPDVEAVRERGGQRFQELTDEDIAAILDEAANVDNQGMELGELEVEVRKIMQQLEAEGFNLTPEQVSSTPNLNKLDEAIDQGVAPDPDVTEQAHQEYIKNTGPRDEVDKTAGPQKEQRFFKRVGEQRDLEGEAPKYAPATEKEADGYANNLVETDLESARQITMNQKSTGDAYYDIKIAQAYADKMAELGNMDEFTDAVRSISSISTQRGKGIAALRNTRLLDPTTEVRKVVKNKKARVAKQVEQEMPKAKKDLSDIQVNKDMLSKILDDLTCK